MDEVVLVDYTEPAEPVSVGNPDAGQTPWALELANEDRCLFISGATITVQGMRLNYQCDNGEAYGSPGGSEPKEFFYQPQGSSELRRVDVATVWQ